MNSWKNESITLRQGVLSVSSCFGNRQSFFRFNRRHCDSLYWIVIQGFLHLYPPFIYPPSADRQCVIRCHIRYRWKLWRSRRSRLCSINWPRDSRLGRAGLLYHLHPLVNELNHGTWLVVVTYFSLLPLYPFVYDFWTNFLLVWESVQWPVPALAFC